MSGEKINLELSPQIQERLLNSLYFLWLKIYFDSLENQFEERFKEKLNQTYSNSSNIKFLDKLPLESDDCSSIKGNDNLGNYNNLELLSYSEGLSAFCGVIDESFKLLKTGQEIPEVISPVVVFSQLMPSNTRFMTSGSLVIELSDIITLQENSSLSFYFPVKFIGDNNKTHETSFVLNYNPSLLPDYIDLNEFFYTYSKIGSFQGAGFGKLALDLIKDAVLLSNTLNGVVLNADNEGLIEYYKKQGFELLEQDNSLYSKVDQLYNQHFGDKNYMAIDLSQ